MELNKKTFAIYTLGCKVNQYDSRYLGELLAKQGCERTEADADVVIVNTCAVTHNAIAKDKRMINKAKKENPGAKVVLMGCWPRAYEKDIRGLDVDLVWGVGKLRDLLAYIGGLLGWEIEMDEDIECVSQEDRARYFLKVQDGCDHFCSYCIIPYTRGDIRSRCQKEILQEARGAARAGFQEVILSGIHLGVYGVDTGTDLTELLVNMTEIQEIKRIRLSSIEAGEVNEKLKELIAENKKICKHLHLPLQSGSDRILKSMNRPYTAKEFADKVKSIRQRTPEIAISTDIITGFPGEEEGDFYRTYRLVEELEFSRLHVFPFSAHEGTPAAKMEGRVRPEIAKQRSAELIRLGEGLEKAFKEKFRGRELEVVVENANGELRRGRSEYYFDMDFSPSQITSYYENSEGELTGKMVRVSFT